MDCKNLNLEELIKKANKFDEVLEKLEKLEKRKQEDLISLQSFFKEKGLKIEGNLCYYGIRELGGILNKLLDANHQSCELAREREINNHKFQDEMRNFEQSMEFRENQLTEAWEKFRAISTKKYKKTLEEMDNENI